MFSALCACAFYNQYATFYTTDEGWNFVLFERYATLLNTLFVTLMYGGGMPFLYPVGAATFVATYWFDKAAFLCRY
jgi:hypothetical protein